MELIVNSIVVLEVSLDSDVSIKNLSFDRAQGFCRSVGNINTFVEVDVGVDIEVGISVGIKVGVDIGIKIGVTVVVKVVAINLFIFLLSGAA